MTISTETYKAGPFTSGSIFPFSFKAFQTSDVRVVFTSASGIESDYVEITDYSISLNADQDANPGGTVTLVSALISGEKCTLIGDIDYTQSADIKNQGSFFPEVIENALDRIVRQTQQLLERIDRTVRFPTSDGALGVGDLPTVDTRKGKFLGFDSVTGEPEALTPGTGDSNPVFDTLRVNNESILGNVGLGVTPEPWNTGGKALEVGNNGNGFFSSGVNTLYEISNAYIDTSGDFRYSNTGTATRIQHQSGEIQHYTAASGTAGNVISWTETYRVTTGGNILVGATSGSFAPGGKGVLVKDATGASFRAECGVQAGEVFLTSTQMVVSTRTNIPVAIQVNGNQVAQWNTAGYYKASNSGSYLTTSGAFHELVNDTGSPGALVASVWNTATSGDNGFFEFYTENSATLRGSIDYNRGGGVARYNTTSDSELKNILGDASLEECLDTVMGCRLREYSWKDDEAQKPQIGVIAQEEYEHFKGSVSVGGETDKGEYKPWAVDKTAYVWHLVGVCQHQQKQIEQLEKRLRKLEKGDK